MVRGDERPDGARVEDDGDVVERILLATATGAGPEALVALLADELGVACCLLDPAGTLRGAAGTPPSPAELETVRAVLADDDRGPLLAWRRFPVPAVRRVAGQLLVRRDGAFATRERVILAAALPALALALDDRAAPEAPSSAAYGTRTALLAGQEPGVLRALTGRLLVPLSAWDAQRGTDLTGTLATFLDTDGRWDATAAALGVHVNTVRNRLARIEQLTGTDLSRLDDRVDFVLALQARELLHPGLQP